MGKKTKTALKGAKAAAAIGKKVLKQIPGLGIAADVALGAADIYLRCQTINEVVYLLRAMIARTMYEYDFDKLTNKDNKHYISKFIDRRNDSILLARCVLALYAIHVYEMQKKVKAGDETAEAEYMRLQSIVKKLKGMLSNWWRIQWESTNVKKLTQLQSLVRDDMNKWHQAIHSYFDTIMDASIAALYKLGYKFATQKDEFFRKYLTTDEEKRQYIENIIEKMLAELQKDKACKALRKSTGMAKAEKNKNTLKF